MDHDHQQQRRQQQEWQTFLNHCQSQAELDEWMAQDNQEEEPNTNNNICNTNHSHWEKLEGSELEPPLRSDAIALVDASWLVSYALGMTDDSLILGEDKCSAKILPCRQQLPDEAFIKIDTLTNTCQQHPWQNRLPIVTLSYMWLTPNHPDPQGQILQCLARWLQISLQHQLNQAQQQHNRLRFPIPHMGVFWDYASLHQHSDPLSQLDRTREEETLFRQGLAYSAALYSHPHTTCCRLTEFPRNHHSPHRVPYFERGWPVFESSLTSMVKSTTLLHTLSFDHDKTEGGDKKHTHTLLPKLLQKSAQRQRTPAPTPEQMYHWMMTRVAFTNAHEDRPLVCWLYRDEFHRRFETVRHLNYALLSWGNDEILQLMHILLLHQRQLQTLDLSGNRFGPEGCRAIAGVVLLSHQQRATRVSRLRRLVLSDNIHISNDGVELLAPAIILISTVELRNVGLGRRGCESLAKAYNQETTNCEEQLRLQTLQLYHNPAIGKEGLSPSNPGTRTEEQRPSNCPLPLQSLQLFHNPAIGKEGLSPTFAAFLV